MKGQDSNMSKVPYKKINLTFTLKELDLILRGIMTSYFEKYYTITKEDTRARHLYNKIAEIAISNGLDLTSKKIEEWE